MKKGEKAVVRDLGKLVTNDEGVDSALSIALINDSWSGNDVGGGGSGGGTKIHYVCGALVL